MNARHKCLHIVRSGEVVRFDTQWNVRVGRLKRQRSATLRLDDTHDRGHAGRGFEFAKAFAVVAGRCKQQLQVRSGKVWPASGKRRRCGDAVGECAFAHDEKPQHLANQRPSACELIDRQFVLYACRDASVIVVDQVLADTGRVMHERNPQRLQLRRGADTREHEQVRRVDRAAAQYDLAPCPYRRFLTGFAKGGTDAPLAFEHQLRHKGLRSHLKIRSRPCRAQQCKRSRTAKATQPGHLRISHSILLGPVIVPVERQSRLLCSLNETMGEIEVRLVVDNVERSVLATELRIA